LLTGPGTPMLFMGEEWGAATPWQYFADHPDPDLAEAVRQGRRREFADHGWAPEDVPDPQDGATVERSRLDWDELARQPHARLLAWYGDLVRIRDEVRDLHDPRPDQVVVHHDSAARTVVVERGAHRVVANLADAPATVTVSARDGDLAVVLAWEEVRIEHGAVTVPARTAAVLGQPGPAGRLSPAAAR